MVCRKPIDKLIIGENGNTWKDQIKKELELIEYTETSNETSNVVPSTNTEEFELSSSMDATGSNLLSSMATSDPVPIPLRNSADSSLPPLTAMKDSIPVPLGNTTSSISLPLAAMRASSCIVVPLAGTTDSERAPTIAIGDPISRRNQSPILPSKRLWRDKNSKEHGSEIRQEKNHRGFSKVFRNSFCDNILLPIVQRQLGSVSFKGQSPMSQLRQKLLEGGIFKCTKKKNRTDCGGIYFRGVAVTVPPHADFTRVYVQCFLHGQDVKGQDLNSSCAKDALDIDPAKRLKIQIRFYKEGTNELHTEWISQRGLANVMKLNSLVDFLEEKGMEYTERQPRRFLAKCVAQNRLKPCYTSKEV